MDSHGGHCHAAQSRVKYEAMKPKVNVKPADDPVFQRVLADALAIQDRFAAEPVYAKTGKGFLKSAGVEELRAAKHKQSTQNKG